MNKVLASKSYRSKPVRSKISAKSKIWFYLNIALAVSLMAAGVAMLFWLGWQSSNNQGTSSNQGIVRPGQPAPDFSLPLLDGDTIRLSDLKGQVVLVNLWATWCPPCKAEMPTIDTFYRAHHEAGLAALMVNMQEDGGTVQAFIKANGFSFPVLLDQTGEMMKLYGVRGLPTTFIVDRQGRIRHIQTGAITQAELEAYVKPLLE